MRDSLLDIAYWWVSTLYSRIASFFHLSKVSTNEPNLLISKYGLTFFSNGEFIQTDGPVDLSSHTLFSWPYNPKKQISAVSITLANDRYVVRKMSPIKLPLSKQLAMAELDLAVATPFKLPDVYILPLVATQNESGESYAIIKKSLLEPVLDKVRQTGSGISKLSLLHDNGDTSFIHKAAVTKLLADGKKKINRLAFISGAAVALIIATFVHSFVRNQNAIAQLEVNNDLLANDAKVVRAIIDQRAGRIAELNELRNEIASSTPVTVVWEELSRALPDSTYLTDLTVKEKVVTISGHAVAASSLIGVLEASPLFEKVEFAGAVVKIPGFEGDRFSINLQLGGKQ